MSVSECLLSKSSTVYFRDNGSRLAEGNGAAPSGIGLSRTIWDDAGTFAFMSGTKHAGASRTCWRWTECHWWRLTYRRRQLSTSTAIAMTWLRTFRWKHTYTHTHTGYTGCIQHVNGDCQYSNQEFFWGAPMTPEWRCKPPEQGSRQKNKEIWHKFFVKNVFLGQLGGYSLRLWGTVHLLSQYSLQGTNSGQCNY